MRELQSANESIPHSPPSGRIVVVGSLNMDLVTRAPRLPRPGETLFGHSFAKVPGGKGANQAVAAARLGASVALIGCIGRDDHGSYLLQELEKNWINCRAVEMDSERPTGVAVIVVDKAGQNSIIIVPGSNGGVTSEMIAQHEAMIAQADVLICQMEIPDEAIYAAMRTARRYGKTVVLNPAPVNSPLPPTWLEQVDFLIPNEIEASTLSGVPVDSIENAECAARKLCGDGVRNVIITLGSRGVFALGGDVEEARYYPSTPAKVLDTTAAGDTFIGGFCAMLAVKSSVEKAIAFGQAAAAISVTRAGAQSSIPYLHEVKK